MNIRIGIFGVLLLLAATGLCVQEKIHTVQRGETFYSIARAMGVKAEDLMKHNGITDPTRLLAGQRLRIPGPAESGAGGFTDYRVVRGDTLFSIARSFSVTVALIREINRLPENYLLREGDTLRLPLEARLPTQAQIPAEAQLPTQARPPTEAQLSVEARIPAEAALPAARLPEARGTEARPLDSSVIWPVAARELSYMTGKLSGVVITGGRAEPVRSLTRGTVLSAGPFQGFGRVVIVQVDGGYLYVYGGCESLSVKEGDRVGPGTEIGRLGIDALSNKPQLFFMVYRSNAPIDPAKAPRA